MKIDTLAALAAAAALAFIGWRAYKATQGLADRAVNGLQAVNPASTENVIYRGVNGVGAAVTGRDDFSLGSWFYDVLNPDPLAEPERAAPRGAQGQRINNPSAYTAAGVTGTGGAAFGIYPRP